AVLMANISNYGSDVISATPHSETYLNDMENQSVHAMQDFKETPTVDFTDNEIHSDRNIIPYNIKTTICKLKATIKSLRENTKEENINHDKCDLQPINKKLENSVAKLLSENEHLCNEINHVKHVFKDQFDSIKQARVHRKEQCDSLINKLNLKSVEKEDLKAQIQEKVSVKIKRERNC
ncbi:hypothetical protein Tco_0094587, partial [Tanacetum coccineum]